VLGFAISITATIAPYLLTRPTQIYITARLREVYNANVNTLDETPKPLLASISATQHPQRKRESHENSIPPTRTKNPHNPPHPNNTPSNNHKTFKPEIKELL